MEFVVLAYLDGKGGLEDPEKNRNNPRGQDGDQMESLALTDNQKDPWPDPLAQKWMMTSCVGSSSSGEHLKSNGFRI